MIAVSRTKLPDRVNDNWQDIDIGAYVGDNTGDVVLVGLEISNTDSSDHNVGLRKNGSTDTTTGRIFSDSHHIGYVIGVDGNDIFEINRDDISVEAYIVTYAINIEAVSFTNGISKAIAASETFEDEDISGDTGEDTSKVAFFILKNPSGDNTTFTLRENGSTDNRTDSGILWGLQYSSISMSVDENEILEGYRFGSMNYWLVGYLKENVTTFTNAILHVIGGTLNQYNEYDLSSDIPADNNGAFAEVYGGSINKLNIRKKGDSWDNLRRVIWRNHLWSETDEDRIVEIKVDNNTWNLYLWGYTKEPIVVTADYTTPIIALRSGWQVFNKDIPWSDGTHNGTRESADAVIIDI